MPKIIFLLFCFSSLFTSAQRIDNTASYRHIESQKYFRITYDNDYFTASDRYYTQGINLELVHSALRKNPLLKTLPKLKNGLSKFGLAVDHFGFTPTSIRRDTIIKNDRPFAAVIMLKSFSISIDTVHKSMLSSSLSIGMIGPAAFGKGMQSTIHRWIGDIAPLGWQFQIRNDIAITYELNHEKLLYGSRFLALNTDVQFRLGTVSNKIRMGINFRTGKFNPVFSVKNSNFQLYFFNQSFINLVGYDATLQGGMFNSSSPYTIEARDINRITFQENFGAVLKFRKLYLEYFQSILSKEFRHGKLHRWGGIKIGGSF